MSYLYTTQKQIRAAFWFDNEHANRKKIGCDYCTDTSVLFCDYIQQLYMSGYISDKMVDKATL